MARLGVSVGRRHGPAAQRNLFKRRVREAFRRNKARIPRGWDWIVTARTPAKTFPPDFAALTQDLLDLVQSAP